MGNEIFYWDGLTGAQLKSYVYHLSCPFTHMHTALVLLNGMAVHGSFDLAHFSRVFQNIFS